MLLAAEKKKEREEKVQQKKMDAQRQKEMRQESAKTPEGRARTWLQGLQDHISKCDTEIAFCRSSTCPLPPGFANEYAALWISKATSFKRTRSLIEAVLRGEKTVKDFEKTVKTSEEAVKSFKDDYQRFKTLCRSYVRKKEAGVSADDEDAAEA